MNKLFQPLGIALALWILASACAREHQEFGPDSETHFLRACGTSSQCGTSSCVCGVCTQTCAVQSQCAIEGPGAQCVTSSDPMCGANKVCDAMCSSRSDCKGLGAGSVCERGRCRGPSAGKASTNSAAAVDRGAGDAGASGDGRDAAGGEIDAAEGDAAAAGPDMDSSTIDASPVADAGRRAENEPCSATLDCADGLVCSLQRCGKDPCAEASCAVIPLPLDSQPCVASTGTRTACTNGTCPTGLICHVDNTCIAPGACDSDGVATLGVSADSSGWNIMALDANYLYGTDRQNNVSRIVRWTINDLQESSLVEGRDAAPVSEVLIVDDAAIYWIGPKQTVDATTLLWRYRLDGTTAAENLGPAGGSLAQDQGYLYLTSTDGSVLHRAPKSAAEGREVIYTMPPGETVGPLAVNSRYVFLTESSGASPQVVRALDKMTLEVQLFPSQTDDKTTTVSVSGLVADEDYCYGNALHIAFRFDISKGNVAVLDTPGLGSTEPLNGRLYALGGSVSSHTVEVAYVDVNTGDRTSVYSFPAVVSGGPWSDFSLLSRSSIFCPDIGGRLVRVVLPP